MPLANPELTEFTTASQAIISYDWTNIADGTGNRLFYGFTTQDSTGINEHLSTEAERSKTIETTGSSGNNFVVTKDFDLTAFNLPTTIGGTGLVSFCIAANMNIAGGTIIASATLKNNTTIIATAISETYSAQINGGKDYIIMPMTINETTFQEGNVLRLTIRLTRAGTQTGTEYMSFTHDPLNRDGTYIIPSTDGLTSQLKINIPFKPFN